MKARARSDVMVAPAHRAGVEATVMRKRGKRSSGALGVLLVACAGCSLSPEAPVSAGRADAPLAPDERSAAPWAWSEPAPAAEGGAGEGLSQVTFAREGADADPCVTPDGEHLVFSSTQHSPHEDIYLKRIGSRVVSRLTTDASREVMPRVSPDGTRIAFASDRAGNWDIFVMPIGGGAAVQVTTDPAHEFHPSWAPDGRSLAFCRLGETSARWEIWRTPAAGESAGQFLTYGMFPEWCPAADAGDRILFQRGRERGDRAFGIWTVDYTGESVESLTEIVSIPGLACINPSWSSDGAWIAFSTVPAGAGADRPQRADLWLIGADGEGLVSLASGQGTNLMPAWGPEQTVYFVSNRGGAENVWSVPVSSAIATASVPGAPAPAEVAEVGGEGGE